MATAARALPDDLANEPRLPAETVQQWVYRVLRRAIMTGRFPPGQAVTIRGLAARLGVSAMPVREALRRLVAERALVLLDNRRVRVPEMTAERFGDLLAARIALETEAAARAAASVDADRFERLVSEDEAIETAYRTGDVEGAIEANLAFHRSLYEARPGTPFLPLIESVWLQLGPFMRAALSDLADHYKVDRHAEALAAIEAGDPAALKRAIEADIRDAIGHLAEDGAPAAQRRRETVS